LRVQQSKIRQYVTESRTETGGRKYLRDQLQAFAAPLARQWNCTVAVAIEPAEIEVTEQLAMDLCLALSEATANAVRHGGARSVEVAVKANEGRLLMEIKNDGKLASEEFPPAPWSLERRVSSLAGTLAVAKRHGNLAVLIDVPLSADVS
jgi:signal transduction histidine kinase